MSIDVPVIVGPTSTGKTKLAIDISKKYSYDIISVDSRQMYKFMDIGTGKIPISTDLEVNKLDDYWIVDGVNIWGYDLIAPDKYFSAYDFALYSLKKMQGLMLEGKKFMLVGGTGFFIDFITGRSKPSEVVADFELRKALEKLSIEELQEKLMSLNIDSLFSIDERNPVRLIRQIEINLQEKNNSTPLPYLDVSYSYFGLTSDRSFLYARSDKWVDDIWRNGIVDEASSLLSKGYENFRPLKGLIYKSAISYINSELSKEDAVQRCKFDIHSYIRRQQTYFKKNQEIRWFDISDKHFATEISNTVQSI